MDSLLSFLGSVPDVIWAAIIASLLTFVGVLLTNKGSERRQRAQLAHDADQREREREMGLRREVLLQAFEAVSAVFGAFGRLNDLNFDPNQVAQGQPSYAGALDKVALVGSEKTVEATAKLSVELSAAALRLLAARAPLIARKNQVDFLSKMIDEGNAKQQSILELMESYNRQGLSDPHQWKYLQDSFDFQQARNQVSQCTREGETGRSVACARGSKAW